jgi:hypothetical protein
MPDMLDMLDMLGRLLSHQIRSDLFHSQLGARNSKRRTQNAVPGVPCFRVSFRIRSGLDGVALPTPQTHKTMMVFCFVLENKDYKILTLYFVLFYFILNPQTLRRHRKQRLFENPSRTLFIRYKA